MNFNTASASFLFITVLALGGCAAEPKEEETSSKDDALIGWLVSPPGFEGNDLEGTWVPYEPEDFTSTPTTYQFSNERSYHVGTPCEDHEAASCAKSGDWSVVNHPIPSSIAGVHVNMRNTNGQEGSLFVLRHISGEVHLVDLSSCGPLFIGGCRNQWTKTPTLTWGDVH